MNSSIYCFSTRTIRLVFILTQKWQLEQRVEKRWVKTWIAKCSAKLSVKITIESICISRYPTNRSFPKHSLRSDDRTRKRTRSRQNDIWYYETSLIHYLSSVVVAALKSVVEWKWHLNFLLVFVWIISKCEKQWS